MASALPVPRSHTKYQHHLVPELPEGSGDAPFISVLSMTGVELLAGRGCHQRAKGSYLVLWNLTRLVHKIVKV